MKKLGAIICLTNIGDGILLSPCISMLKKYLPENKWILIAKPSICDLYSNNLVFKEFIPYTASWFPGPGGVHDGFKGFIKTALKIRQLNCKIGLNTASDTRTNLLCRFGGIKRLISVYARHGNWLSTKMVSPETDYEHEVVRLLRLSFEVIKQPAKEQFKNQIFLLQTEKENSELLYREIRNRSKPIVGIHPGANVLKKTWALDKFVVIGKYLTKKNATVVVFGAPGEETDLANKFCTAINQNVINLAGRTSVKALIAFLGKCDLYIGNDSGPMHMAALVDCPVVAIFGASNYLRFGPYLHDNLKQVVISKEYRIEDANKNGIELLNSISTKMVVNAIKRIWPIVEERSLIRNSTMD